MCAIYPEIIGKEFKWEARMIENWRSFSEDLETKIQLVKLVKCKSPAKYVMSCPLDYNSKISCLENVEWNEIVSNENLCTICNAVTLMEDLVHRCNALTQDKAKNQKEAPEAYKDINDDVYNNIIQGTKRIDIILDFAGTNDAVMHKINWNEFVDCVRTIAMATNCLVLTDELFDDLIRKTNMKKPRRAKNYNLDADKIPGLLNEFMTKVLPEETLKINRKMVEGNDHCYYL